MVKVSIILCTHGRCDSLARTLESVAAQTLPEPAEWEVLVVDNASNDKTREVVEDFCRLYPGRFRYLFEPRPGKSYALNLGVQESQGDILAFADDDVTFEPNWLRNLTTPLWQGEWAGVGGRVVPEWAGGSPPSWLSLVGPYRLGATLALFDRGLEPHEMDENPFGVNMAFRKSMFAKHGGFRNDMGPRAGSRDPQKSEDAEFGRRLLRAGERFFYEPSAVVHHWVPLDRMQKKYFLKWWFDKGRSTAWETGAPSGLKCCLGIPLHLWRKVITSTIRWMMEVRSTPRFYRKIRVCELTGEFVESYRQSLAAKTKKECNA
jgi:glucosyl-dolichyl phosphate glucuronosyltransferase